MPTEIEVKFQLGPDKRALVEQHPLLVNCQEGSARLSTLISTYYDTPELALKQKRVALRVRETGQGFVQTIKGETKSQDGLSEREEWEWPLQSSRPDWHKLAQSPFAEILQAEAEERFAPVFRTIFKRRASVHVLQDGTRVEVALDEGFVEAGSLREPIFELELELLEGSPTTLVSFAAQLRETLQLTPGDLSKAKRGYALFGRSKASP